MTHRVYVYGPQQTAAQSMLDACNMFPGGRLQRVNDVNHIRGLSGGTFIVVTGHPNRVPAAIMDEIEHIGMVLFEMDDRFPRANAARRMSAA